MLEAHFNHIRSSVVDGYCAINRWMVEPRCIVIFIVFNLPEIPIKRFTEKCLNTGLEFCQCHGTEARLCIVDIRTRLVSSRRIVGFF